MKKLTAMLLAMLATTASAGDKQDVLIVFKLTSDQATAEYLEQLDVQLAWSLTETGKYELVKASDLADEMLMPPAESLAFCKGETECIADLGSGRKARWIVYGDIKNSFDGKKILMHLVLVDVPGKKLTLEKFGQLSKQEDLVTDAAALLRGLLGIEAELALDLTPQTKPGPETPAVKEPPGEKTELQKPVAIRAKPPVPGAKSPWTNAWTWSAAGAGVAAMSAAVIMGVISKQKLNDAKTPGIDQPTAYDLYDDAKGLALGANIAYGLGGAALCAAAVIFILDVSGDEPAALPSLACSGTGCELGFSTRF
ncbi:MAG TPA: hypothetical protein VM425_16080 [Myxococcota bacterium]|nr:hypothetical protein [Myxococcota bacterium]